MTYAKHMAERIRREALMLGWPDSTDKMADIIQEAMDSNKKKNKADMIVNTNEIIEAAVKEGIMDHIFNPEFGDKYQSVYQITGHDLVDFIGNLIDMGRNIGYSEGHDAAIEDHMTSIHK